MMNGTFGGNYISKGYIGWNSHGENFTFHTVEDSLFVQEALEKVFFEQIFTDFKLVDDISGKLFHVFGEMLNLVETKVFKIFHFFRSGFFFGDNFKRKLNGIHLIWSRLKNRRLIDWYKKPNRQIVWSRLRNKKTVDWYKKPNRDK